MTLRELLGRLAAWRRREELDRELTDELQEHLTLLEEEYEREGLSPAEARAAAHRRLGHLASTRAESRDAWGFPALERRLQDLRYALRGLRRSPGFTVAAILTLALGIGANAAMFAVLDRVMFRPYPLLRDPSTVNRVYLQTTFQGRRSTNTVFPYTRFADLQRETQSFSHYAAVSEWRFAVGRGDDTRVRKVAGVSAAFFGFFDAAPVHGRYFTASEDALPLGTTVAVISAAFWRREFGGDDVVGRQLKVGSLDYRIVGVAPADFVGTVSGEPPEVFVPITTIAANLGPYSRDTYWLDYRWDWVEMLVRRKPGVSVEAANADLTQAYVRSRAQARELNPRVMADSLVQPRGLAGPVKTAAGPERGDDATVLLWVSGVAIVVLLIACASVANLMVARLLQRRREVSIRLALGVSRRRLLAQFIAESLLLSALGLAAGLVFAQWSGTLIRALLLPEGSAFNLAQDARTFAVGIALVLLTTLLTALGPMVIAGRGELGAMLRGGGRDGAARRSRVRNALLVFQVALSVVLLIGAGLFVRSFGAARALPLGYDAGPVVEAVLDARGESLGDEQQAQLQRQMLEAAEAIPGVEAATTMNTRLFRSNTADLWVPGVDSVASLGRFNFQLGSPSYFQVMRIAIIRGRGFDASDRQGSVRVAIVSEAMAERLWPDREALGQCLHVSLGDGGPAIGAPCTTVVGIAGNTRQQALVDDDPMLTYYLVAEQFAPGALLPIALRLRTSDPTAHVERIRAALTRAMPGDGLAVVRPMQEMVDNQSSAWRLGATLFTMFGGLALLVASVGLYGVISYDVTTRAHELGLRRALGAQAGDVLRLVVGQGLRVTALGVIVGALLALGASRWVEPLLFRVRATDPVTYAAVLGTMLAVALVASLVPARRALGADPMQALRGE